MKGRKNNEFTHLESSSENTSAKLGKMIFIGACDFFQDAMDSEPLDAMRDLPRREFWEKCAEFSISQSREVEFASEKDFEE